MNQCLVTKLKGVASDNSLMRLGEFRIKVNKVTAPTSKTQGFTFLFNKDAKIEIIGDGYFTDKALKANNGKILELSANKTTSVYVSNGDFEVAVLDKYSLVRLLFYAQGETNVGVTEMSNRSMSIDDLKYSTALTSINLSRTQVSGDISALQNLTALTTINLSSTQVSGNISALQNLTALTTINLENCTGNLSSLSSSTKLTYCSLKKSAITGDLASLAATCYFASFQNDSGSSLSWTTRPSTSNIIAIEGRASMEGIDKMLQDQAQCVKAIPASGQSWFKTISVAGNRTSASDDAVVTLQEKGYTISITRA